MRSKYKRGFFVYFELFLAEIDLKFLNDFKAPYNCEVHSFIKTSVTA